VPHWQTALVRRRFAFLPGASGRGDFWDPVRERLGASVREPLTFDWPGLGGVVADPKVQSFEDLATYVIERLTGPTVLVAQSMGGVVATMVAKRRPDLVSHLVLAVTSGGVDLASRGAADWRPGSRIAHPDNPTWLYESVDDLTPVLAQLPMKTLLVWASDDSISPHTVGEHLRRLIPRSRLVTFDSDDHWVARIFADEVAAEIEQLVTPYVGFLHTSEVHVETFGRLVDAAGDDDVATVHLVMEQLLQDARIRGVDDPQLAADLRDALVDLVVDDADVIVCTCSTIGGLAEQNGAAVPVVRGDRPMCADAVATGSRIAVVVAVESTIAPTMALLQNECQRQQRWPSIVVASCLDAWTHWEAGDPDAYHRAIAQYVDGLADDFDTVVLGQASMLGARTFLAQRGGRRVLVSPPSAVDAALALLRT
jgi:pimeloyl-ACP methyl ester carboxylesterase